jgi:2-polyprenyl-3-methyl-5-hydroxy-6-metoxy-1,4-benzoquinol methylase
MNGLPGDFTLAQCDRCKLVFQDPRPTEATVKLAYPDSYAVYQPATGDIQSTKWKQLLSNLVLANYYGYAQLAPSHWLLKSAVFPLYAFRFRPRSVPVFKPGGKLLEIGCTWGGRLDGDRARGWSVIGVDFNERAIQWGRSHLGLDLRLGSIFDLDFPDATFDTIVFDMVLEHLHRPQDLFTRIDRWLKPDGEILFSIPYFEGAEFKLFKHYAYGLQLPAHLYFFNKTHVRTLLGNYRDIEFRFQHAEKDLIAPLGYLADDGHTALRRVAKSRVLRHAVFKPLAFGLSLLQRSSRVSVRARKALT